LRVSSRGDCRGAEGCRDRAIKSARLHAIAALLAALALGAAARKLAPLSAEGA
jgi:hypothetical protein